MALLAYLGSHLHQCWIAPGIQHYFDVYVNKIHPDLVKYLKENNPKGMIIDVPESKG